MRTIHGIALGLALLLPTGARAAIGNGFFDLGLASWTAGGDFSVETGTFGPPGDPMLILTTSPSSGTPAPAPLGGGVDTVPNILTLLGISAATLEANDPPGFDASEGSGVVQTFSYGWAGTATLSFDWQLFTDETLFANPFPDFAIFHVRNQAGTFTSTQMFVDVRTQDTAGNFVPSGTVFDGELPVSTFNLVLPAPDTYTIGIALFDVTDDEYDTALSLDNFQLVPEPSSWALLALGVLGLVHAGRGRTRA